MTREKAQGLGKGIRRRCKPQGAGRGKEGRDTSEQGYYRRALTGGD